MLDEDLVCTRARVLAEGLEAFAAQYIFSPECHANYEALGFGPSPRQTAGGVAFPEGVSYLLARSSSLGQAPGEVVAAVFAAFNPALVVPGVALGWTMTDPPTMARARDDGSIAQLSRILGSSPEGLSRGNELLAVAVGALKVEGKPLFAGLSALGLPGSPLGDAWRRADMLREYRGDAHVAAWTSAGLDSVEASLLAEAWWGIPLKTYSATRVWTDDDLDGGIARLEARGLLADGSITPAGRARREDVERRTDLQLRPAVEALGDDHGELVSIVSRWSDAVIAAKGYLADGPAELAT